MRTSLLLAVLLAAGCHDGDGDGATAFAPLVNDLIQNQTSERGEPVETNGKTFAFPADGAAFDALLPPDDGTVVE
jgi:hypothetical protein